MTLPRPVRVHPLRTLGRATALTALPLALLAGCSNSLRIENPPVDAADVAVCEEFVGALPDELFGQEQRDVTGTTAAAAWGDPPIVLQCGAHAPAEFDPFSSCTQIDDVGWFMPDTQLKDQTKDIVLTAQSHAPRVSVTVPAQFRQNAPDTQLDVLGKLVAEHLTEVQPCV